MQKPKLTVIILNYNTKELLDGCLASVKKYSSEVPMQVIVSDNASTDGSVEMVKKKHPWVEIVEGPNSGFSKGNNRARKMVKGSMVLFLNPDTVVKSQVFAKTVRYLEEHPKVGALTCKLVLENGKLDKDTRRRFPTPWISFKRLFLKNGKDYWYEDISENKVHEVDAVQGAFFLTRKKILDKVGWFDEGYLFNGEDLDLSFQIKKLGYKIIYYPKVSIIHFKGAAKGKTKKWKHKTTKAHKIKMGLAEVDAMERFYKKNLWERYPLFFNYFVLVGIRIYKVLRLVKNIFR